MDYRYYLEQLQLAHFHHRFEQLLLLHFHCYSKQLLHRKYYFRYYDFELTKQLLLPHFIYGLVEQGGRLHGGGVIEAPFLLPQPLVCSQGLVAGPGGES